MKAPLLEEKKTQENKGKERSWGDNNQKKQYGLMDFFKFIFPFLWKGGLIIKINTILTFLLLIVTKGLNVVHPLILKYVIDDITLGTAGHNQADTFFMIGMYSLTRFSADFINYIREIPFATVSASAEIYVADLVYNHIQHQSLAFHLSRETGKVIRIVSRGSQSFASILRYTCFSLLPIILELTFVLGVIYIIYPWEFFAVTFLSVMLYIFVTVCITEWRAKYFKKMAQKDTEYNQKATDSLLNFETVKYFNAEKHEQDRFLKALGEYKKENVTVANSLVVLNIAQAFIIALGLSGSLFLAYNQITGGAL